MEERNIIGLPDIVKRVIKNQKHKGFTNLQKILEKVTIEYT